MCIPVYNLESYEYLNVRFVVKVIFSPIKFYEKIYFH